MVACFLFGELAVRYPYINKLLSATEKLECLNALVSGKDLAVCIYCWNFNKIEFLEAAL